MAKLALKMMTSCLVLTASVANSAAANNATLMEAITNNVRAVCQSPSDQGKHWSVKAQGDGGATISLRLANIANLNVRGKAEFTKEEWEGVQQVLKKQQLDENKDYRACARELTPKFLEKFAPSTEISKDKPSRTSNEANSVSQECSGANCSNINDVKEGDVNIRY